MQLWLQSQNFPAEENKERGVKHLLKIVSMQRAAAARGVVIGLPNYIVTFIVLAKVV